MDERDSELAGDVPEPELPKFRSFTDPYRNYLHNVRGGWPPHDLLQKWFTKHCGFTGGTNTELRRGGAVDIKYIDWFIRLLVSSHHPQRMEQARRETLAFVSRFGITELSEATADAVREHICHPPVPHPTNTKRFIDYLRFPVEVLSDIIFSADFDSWARSCPDTEVRQMVDWIYLRVAHETAPRGRKMDDAESYEFAKGHMGIDRARYADQVQAWKRQHPWSVVRAWQKGAPVGVNIMLPLSQRAYEEVRAGRRTPYKCGPEDFDPPSLHIVLEAVAEKPSLAGQPGPKNPTRPLRVSTLYQLAALTRCNLLKRPAKLRLLSFAGTPENEDRLRDLHFVATKEFMLHPHPDVKLHIYERVVNIGGLITKDFVSSGLLEALGKRLPASPWVEGD